MWKGGPSRDLDEQHRDQPRRLFLRSSLLYLRSSRLARLFTARDAVGTR